VFDNPEIIIKAHCKYINYNASQCKNLASSAIFCYNQGAHYAPNYTNTIQKAREHGIAEKNINDGIKYVYNVFKLLDNSFYASKDVLAFDEPYDSFAANVS
jgi:hypothetical protein